MKLSFRIAALGVSLLCFALAAIWVFAPDLFFTSWRVEASPAAYFSARRGAALYLGFGVLAFLARDVEPSPARNAIALAFGTWLGALAALGIVEFAVGDAGAGIWSAIVVEIVLSVVFFMLGRAPRAT